MKLTPFPKLSRPLCSGDLSITRGGDAQGPVGTPCPHLPCRVTGAQSKPLASGSVSSLFSYWMFLKAPTLCYVLATQR